MIFTLCIDNFGIKYVGKEHAEHLLKALQTRYTVTTDWTGTLFLGIKLKWNYKAGTVDLSMPGYIKEALKTFHHPVPPRPEDSPYPAPNTKWGPDSQLTVPNDESKRLDAGVSTLLYYARAIYTKMVKALGYLLSQQAEATNTTAKRMTQLFNYAASHPDATIRYT